MSRNLLAGGGAAGSMSCACFAVLLGATSRNLFAGGGTAGSMSCACVTIPLGVAILLGATSRNILAGGGAAGSMSCACFAIILGATSRNILAGGAAGSMSWRDLFLEPPNLLLLLERHFAHVFNTFAVESGGCFL